MRCVASVEGMIKDFNLNCEHTCSLIFLTPELPRSGCQFSPLAATHFLVNWLQEFASKIKIATDKFEYSPNLFAG